MKKYILALDAGTTSSRAIIFDHDGKIVAVSQKEFTQHFLQPGWVEHDPEEIWQTQLFVMKDVLASSGIKAGEIEAVGITNQRETTMVWDRLTGKPVYNAIVWQDRRTAAMCDEINKAGRDKLVFERTGLVVDAYFSATKIKWILDNEPFLRKRADYGDLAFGTVDSWLVWKLTNGRVHITDVSNASRTMLFNIHKLQWDPELLNLFEIPLSVLPQVKPSSEVYGNMDSSVLGVEIPLAGIAGDQQAALFGQMCVEEGMAKNTYGTGCFVMMNTGVKPAASKHRLLTTIAWQIGDKTEYAMEGSVFIGGALVQWLRDNLKIIRSSSEIESLAASVEDNGGVYVVPAFAGLGAPHWDQHARGIIAGLTRGTTNAHIARAALEAIAFQNADVINVMKKDSEIGLNELRVDGGASVNDLLMQMQADLIGVPVVRPKVTETTALGAAYLAGLATGFWKSVHELKNKWLEDKTFKPGGDPDDIRARWKMWNKALERTKNWLE